MLATVVGYTGGTSDKATYRSIGDHTETVLVFYDPAVTSYARLLEVFWGEHDPRYGGEPKQYRNVVFAMDSAQEALALASRKALGARLGADIATPVEVAGAFHPAEDYHQKYYLRSNETLYRELKTRYPTEADFVGSTAATRVNGLLGARGVSLTEEEAIDLGLGPAGRRALASRLR